MKVYSPQPLCSFQRRTGPCSGRCNTVGRLTYGKDLLVGQWRVNARPPMTVDMQGQSPAWRWQETSIVASVCAQPERAAWWQRFYKSLKSAVGSVPHTVIILQCTLNVPLYTWPTFSTPAQRGQHRKVRKLQKDEKKKKSTLLGKKTACKLSLRCNTENTSLSYRIRANMLETSRKRAEPKLRTFTV